ncbi:ferritin-like domain-containing protein [Aquihabitans sp. G128]|uniref:ferritin-like domain-containing protein n=1 Tax=Aquihabitans sp. G128 TaxID=2849779 RepID=UPI001C23589D|nr:ferritin-like domain-containing protein [Aquihabitans sp. G128]QXC59382.1 ferritin-like domain-containing protein [Aquihabitans sp. G128]
MSNETMNDTTITEEPKGLHNKVLGRRGFLGAAGALGAAAFLAACGSDSDSDGGTATTADKSTTTAADGGSTTTAPASGGGGDLKVAAFAASLEVLAVNTYGAALDAAGKGSLGDVPPAVAEFVTTAQKQHQSALDKWNEVLKGAGEDEVSDPPADLEKTVNDAFGKVKDVGGAAKLALMLEQIAAATYLSAIPTLSDEGAIKLAASIQPIDMQHVAVLNFVLGEYPVPDTFGSTDMAASPS